MESNNMDRELVGIQFPGIVKNDDKAIACLGGIRSISQVSFLLLFMLIINYLATSFDYLSIYFSGVQ